MRWREVIGWVLVVLLAHGCGRDAASSFVPVHGHYGVASQWVGIDSGPGAELFYRDDAGKLTRLWPYLGTRGYPMLFEKDMAFFIAEMPDEQGRVGNGTFFAVDGPGPVLDVSDDLLKFWAEKNKLDFATLRRRYAPLIVNEVPGGFEVEYLQDPKDLEAKFVVTWEELARIIEDVKVNGTRHQSYGETTAFICKDYGSPRVPRRRDW